MLPVARLVDPSISFTQDQLDNGLRLVVSEDHRLPLAAVVMWYDVGSRDEPAGKAGLAHLVERLVFEHARQVDPAATHPSITAAGGSSQAATGFDETIYYDLVPSHVTPAALRLEAHRMSGLQGSFAADHLDGQRTLVRNREGLYDNFSYACWPRRLFRLLFPEGHPYHRSLDGELAGIDDVSVDDIERFYRAHYAPNRAVLAVVGDVDPAQVRSWAEEFFGHLPPVGGGAPSGRPPAAAFPADVERRELVWSQIAVPKVFMGYQAPAYGTLAYDALVMGTAILGMGAAGRLQRRLRVRRHLATEADIWTWAGTCGVSTTIGELVPHPDVDVLEAERVFHETVGSLVAAPASDEELERAITMLRARVLKGRQWWLARAFALARAAANFKDANRANTQIERLTAVTADDIAEVAADVFRPANRAVLVYLPDGQAADNVDVLDARRRRATSGSSRAGLGQSRDHGRGQPDRIAR